MYKTMRFPELDVLRTLAILGMIIYHGAYDLVTFYDYDFQMMQGGWLILQRTVAITFLLLVGISFAISCNRTSAEKIWIKFLKRGLTVIACGYLVSIVTYIIDPVTYVRFGILHLIGVSIILLPFFMRFKRWNLLIATVIFLSGSWIRPIILPANVLLPLGFMPPFFKTVDYFPLLPWFSTVLIGLVKGKHFTYAISRGELISHPHSLHLTPYASSQYPAATLSSFTSYINQFCWESAFSFWECRNYKKRQIWNDAHFQFSFINSPFFLALTLTLTLYSPPHVLLGTSFKR